MKKMLMSLALCLGLLVGFAGCENVVPPIKLPVNLFNGITGPNSFTIGAGGTISGANAYEGPIELPTEEELLVLVRAAAGDLLGGLIGLDRMIVEEVRIDALSGDFSWATGLRVEYQPKPVNGVEQAWMLVADVAAPEGFGDQIVITPEPLDYLQLVRDNDANDGPGSPRVRVLADGVVPDEEISFNVDADVLVYVTVL